MVTHIIHPATLPPALFLTVYQPGASHLLAQQCSRKVRQKVAAATLTVQASASPAAMSTTKSAFDTLKLLEPAHRRCYKVPSLFQTTRSPTCVRANEGTNCNFMNIEQQKRQANGFSVSTWFVALFLKLLNEWLGAFFLVLALPFGCTDPQFDISDYISSHTC